MTHRPHLTNARAVEELPRIAHLTYARTAFHSVGVISHYAQNAVTINLPTGSRIRGAYY
jgi:hypothetical protein